MAELGAISALTFDSELYGAKTDNFISCDRGLVFLFAPPLPGHRGSET